MASEELITFLQLESTQEVITVSLRSMTRSLVLKCESLNDIPLQVASSLLQLFVQYNWTGPKSPLDLSDILKLSAEDVDTAEQDSFKMLAVDTEAIYERTTYPILLSLSRHILTTDNQLKSMQWLVWELYSIFVHQSMIDENCHSLKTQAMVCIEALMKMAGLSRSSSVKESSTSHDSLESASSEHMDWLLVAVWLCRRYFEYQTCKRLLEFAQQLSGLAVQFDGVPGKRTRFQQKDIAQLVLKVTSNSSSSGNENLERPLESQLPKNEPLHDDTVLDKMNLVQHTDSSELYLTPIQQALILALCEENAYVKAEDTDIIEEESSAFLNYVLSYPQDYSVQAKALFMRSLSEKRSMRRMERSLRQLEELTLMIDHSKPDVKTRLKSVYSACLPPSWVMQRTLGELHMEMGSYASAMETFDKLGLWTPLIVCSYRAGRTGKAVEIIKQRLAVEETPTLLCSLSDVTNDPVHYEKAWELSGKRFARAMKGLAFYHLRACEYEKANECFEKTLSLNPLQLSCWFSYGCSSLASQHYDRAATAFRRCVTLESDNYEAWNNLAAAYARSQQKPRAFAVLQDALKCSYDNWRIWENYVLIGADCGEISEAIKGAHRILELKNKWSDEEVIQLLTRLVIEDIPDAYGTPSSTHRQALLELLGHTTAKTTSSSIIWTCYGRLILSPKNQSPENIERGIQCLQKGYRCACNEVGWEKNIDKCRQTTTLLRELIVSCLNSHNNKFIGTARIQLKGHIAKIKQSNKSIDSPEILNVVEELENWALSENRSLLS